MLAGEAIALERVYIERALLCVHYHEASLAHTDKISR